MPGGRDTSLLPHEAHPRPEATGEILVSANGIGVSKKGGGFAFAKGGTSFGTNTTDFRESAIGEAQAMACAEIVKAIVAKKDRLE